MNLLNLCAGATRPQGPEWTNLDSLHSVLALGTPERKNLDREKNYVNWDIPSTGALPFPDEHFDGIVASHCVEHWDIHQAVNVLRECRRILKPHGELLVSVPDATVFRQNWYEDTVENAERIYGEPIYLPDGHTTFMGYAGFNRHHKVLLSEDSLWCYLDQAGYREIHRIKVHLPLTDVRTPLQKMATLLNRLPFSLIMVSTK